jgi:selenocysteine lyase/cysteine desulfurase
MTLKKPDRREFLRTAGAGAVGLSALAPFSTLPASFASELERERSDRRVAGFADLRRSYDLAEGVTYLNHASIGTVPRSVRDAMTRYVETCESNPWLYIWGHAWDEAWDRSRRRAAEFIGCEPEELALTHNTTEAFNLLAHGLPLGRGDEVLFSSLNHVGASAAWEYRAADRGFRVRRFDFPVADAPSLTVDEIVGHYADQVRKRTRVVVLPHIDNVVGIRHPVREIAAAVRERGVEFVAVDAAQTVGMIPLDVSALGVDVYATSGHKWLQTPKELGLMYVSRESQAALRPMWVTWGQKNWSGSARGFEDYGTRDMPKIMSLANSVDYQESLGRSNVERHLRQLRDLAIERIDATDGLTWHSPRDWELGGSLWAVGFKPVDGVGAKALSERLFHEQGLVIRPFESFGLNMFRVSPNAANTSDEIGQLLDALDSKGA